MRGYCEACKPIHSAKARFDASRPSAAKRGYGRQWQKERLAHFRAYPFCVDPYRVHGYWHADGCGGERRWIELPIEATVLDHKVPHRGDAEKFKDPHNRQGLCDTCHNRKTATEDSAFAGHPGVGKFL